MPAIFNTGDRYGGVGGEASTVALDNSANGLRSTNVQDAINEIAEDISTLNSRRWTFLTAIQANGTYTVPDLSQYKEYQVRAFLTNIRLTLLYDDIANFTTIFPEWTDGNRYVYCKIQYTNNTTLTVSDSTISSMSPDAYFYVYGK